MSRKFDLGNPVEPRRRWRFRLQYGDMPHRSKSHTVSATADHREIFATPTRTGPMGPSESLPVAQISQTSFAKFTSSPDDRSVQSTKSPEFQQTLSVESLPMRKGDAAVVPSDVKQGSSLGRSDCVILLTNGDAGERHFHEIKAHTNGWKVLGVAWEAEAFGAKAERSPRQMELPS